MIRINEIALSLDEDESQLKKKAAKILKINEKYINVSNTCIKESLLLIHCLQTIAINKTIIVKVIILIYSPCKAYIISLIHNHIHIILDSFTYCKSTFLIEKIIKKNIQNETTLVAICPPISNQEGKIVRTSNNM